MSKQPGERGVYELPAAIETLADGPEFNSHERLAHAARLVMARHVRKLYKHLPGVLAGNDPHAIHQMRVATRRLRACLGATEIAFEPDVVQPLRKRLRNLARALGAVRDRDVMLLRLRDDAANLPQDEQHALQPVIARLQAERDNAHHDLMQELERKRTARLLQRLTEFLTCPLEAVQAADHGLPLRVRHHAGSAVWHAYEAVLRFETALPHASAEQLHELRIACKHLRYTLELFEPAVGKDVAGLIELVTAMQEHLGNLHDADVADMYLGIHNDQPAPSVVPISELTTASTRTTLSYHQQRALLRSRLRADVQPLWERLSGDQTRRKLGKAIAGL